MRQYQIKHGGFVQDEKVNSEWISFVVLEAFDRRVLQQAMDGAGSTFRRLGEPLGGTASRGSQGITFVLGFERGDQSLQAGGLPRSWTSGEDADRMGQCHLQGGALLFRQILHVEGEQIDHHGCLSVPGVPGDSIKRAAKVHLRALDRHGKPFELDAEDVLAICIQHEMDHLKGTLFIDHISFTKGNKIKNQIKKSGYPSKEEIALKKAERKKVPVQR